MCSKHTTSIVSKQYKLIIKIYMTIIIKSWLVKLAMLWIQLVNSGNFTKRSKPI